MSKGPSYKELLANIETTGFHLIQMAQDHSDHQRGIEDLCREWNLLRLEIPMGYPDGTGVLTPLQWVKGAKDKLGYF